MAQTSPLRTPSSTKHDAYCSAAANKVEKVHRKGASPPFQWMIASEFGRSAAFLHQRDHAVSCSIPTPNDIPRLPRYRFPLRLSIIVAPRSTFQAAEDGPTGTFRNREFHSFSITHCSASLSRLRSAIRHQLPQWPCSHPAAACLLRLAHIHPAIVRLPGVDRVLRHAHLPRHVPLLYGVRVASALRSSPLRVCLLFDIFLPLSFARNHIRTCSESREQISMGGRSSDCQREPC